MKNISTLIFISLLFISDRSFCQFTAISNSPISSDGLESKGASWVDYDSDGDDDLFVTTSLHENLSRKNLLYKNNGDGTFSKITAGDLVNVEATGRNSTWADFNNDGLVDVFVANQHENFLYKNSGGGVFTKQLAIPTTELSTDSDHSGGVWGDYNGDGYVDLFLSNYKLNDDARNVLYLNNKDESFTQIPESNVVSTQAAGADPAWIDFDNNGTLDLFVPNYCAGNFLYSNQGNGNFSSVANHALLLSNCSVGSSWADYDNDGDFDVVIQNNVNQSNQFFENNGDGSFTEKFNAITAHTSSSAAWGDFDNDGFIDLVQVGGYPENKTYLYKNNGDGSFREVSDQQGITNTNYSWGVAWADYDKDGFLDFFIANSYAEPQFSPNDILYHNTPNGNGWINIKLKGSSSNHSAIGAVVKINAGGKWQFRTVQSKTGNNSQNSLNVHFGIGLEEKIDTLQVTWPNQGHQQLLNQSKNNFIEITEIDFPSAPIDLLSAPNEPFKVDLTWSDTSSIGSSFRLERSVDSTNFKVIVHEILAEQYTDEDVEGGFKYYYRVAKNTEGGFSPYSGIVEQFVRSQQTISFDAISDKEVLDQPFSLEADASSGLDVFFVISEGNDKISLDGNQISLLDTGRVTIGAFALQNELFLASDTIFNEFLILRSPQSVSFDAVPDKELSDQPFELMAESTSGLDVSFFIDEGQDMVSLSGAQVSIIDNGLIRIGAHALENQKYLPSDTVFQEFNVFVLLSIKGSKNHISVYPNPTDHSISISSQSGLSNHESLISIYSATGALVKSAPLKGTHSSIQLNDLKPGIYFLHIDNQVFRLLKK